MDDGRVKLFTTDPSRNERGYYWRGGKVKLQRWFALDSGSEDL